MLREPLLDDAEPASDKYMWLRLIATVVSVSLGSSLQFGFATGSLNNLEQIVPATLAAAGNPINIATWAFINSCFSIGGLFGSYGVVVPLAILGRKKTLMLANIFGLCMLYGFAYILEYLGKDCFLPSALAMALFFVFVALCVPEPLGHSKDEVHAQARAALARCPSRCCGGGDDADDDGAKSGDDSDATPLSTVGSLAALAAAAGEPAAPDDGGAAFGWYASGSYSSFGRISSYQAMRQTSKLNLRRGSSLGAAAPPSPARDFLPEEDDEDDTEHAIEF